MADEVQRMERVGPQCVEQGRERWARQPMELDRMRVQHVADGLLEALALLVDLQLVVVGRVANDPEDPQRRANSECPAATRQGGGTNDLGKGRWALGI